MQRLLMGEVGRGKTVIAVYAMLRALEAGRQAALMAPTETLAEQHASTLERLLAAEATPFALLTGATPAAGRRDALDRLASGELGLVVGTHALIEAAVHFARLGRLRGRRAAPLRVGQRAALDAKGAEGMRPHVLHMTATPIPRTLSLTAYGDLDSTVLHELPPAASGEDLAGGGGQARRRLRVRPRAAARGPPGLRRLPAGLRVREAARQGGGGRGRAAGRGELADFEVGVLHGQMPSAQKAAAMRASSAGRPTCSWRRG